MIVNNIYGEPEIVEEGRKNINISSVSKIT